MTYRGQVRNGAVVLEPPAELPEGATVEVSIVASPQQRAPLRSIEQLRGAEPGDDTFDDSFELTIRQWRNETWRSAAQELPE